MGFTMDPEVAAGLALLASSGDRFEPAPLGDVAGRRLAIEAMLRRGLALLPIPSDVHAQDVEIPAVDGSTVLARWYSKSGLGPGSAVLHIHGGGMILGSVDIYDGHVRRYVSETDVPMLAVEYRRAPEHPHPLPVEDCYSALTWLAENAQRLGVAPARIAVLGDSAGGGLAAATAILARDRQGPSLARQVLIYPMLDDRTTEPDPRLHRLTTWSYIDNATGWGALLGSTAGGPDVPPHAAPARLTDAAGLPPTYLDVGELDIFRRECIEYAQLLMAGGVSTELHVRPAAPHGFDTFAPDSSVARRSRADVMRALRGL